MSYWNRGMKMKYKYAEFHTYSEALDFGYNHMNFDLEINDGWYCVIAWD